jgi:hypothetical protein
VQHGWAAKDPVLRSRWFYIADAWLETAKERRDHSGITPLSAP